MIIPIAGQDNDLVGLKQEEKEQVHIWPLNINGVQRLDRTREKVFSFG